MASKPKRLPPPSYYESRTLLAECFGLNEDSEPLPQSESVDDFGSAFKAAIQSNED